MRRTGLVHPAYSGFPPPPQATHKALAETDKESLSRSVKLWFAAHGTRGVLNDMNTAFVRMIDLRRDQLASVEKRLADERDDIGEPWIAQLPQGLPNVNTDSGAS